MNIRLTPPVEQRQRNTGCLVYRENG
jgi:hypothetical protein